MLNFDSNHDTIVRNKQQDKVSHRKVAIAGLLASISLWMTGCAETIDCNIAELHVHKFESSSSFDTYSSSEKEYLFTLGGDFFYRTDEYVLIDEEEKELLEFEKKYGLFRISDNKDVIDELISYQDDFILYEYEYTQKRQVRVGKVVSFRNEIKTDLTNDSNRDSLTGNTKIGHYVYWGYKIVRNEKGKLKVVASECVNSLEELSPEYIYIGKEFYKVVDLESFEELNYQDDLKRNKTIEDVKSSINNKAHKSRIKRK